MCSGSSQAEDMRKRRLLKSKLYGSAGAGPLPIRPRALGATTAGSVAASFSQDQNASSIASPATTLTRPRKRIWPSLICKACSKIRRHEIGLMKGSSPSATSIRATALSATSQNATDPNRYFRAGAGAGRGAATGGALGPRIDLKKSLLGSTIIRSDLLRKLARYASRLR